MRVFLSARRVIAAFLMATAVLPARPADATLASEGLSSRSVGHAHARITVPDGTPLAVRGDHASPVVFVLPDQVWDARRVWPYLDDLSLFGVTVVELWPDDDERFGPAEAHVAIASAIEAFGLHRSQVALLGFGTGGRLALALAGPARPGAALYPACHGASVPDPGARVMVLHPDEVLEERACAALIGERPGAISARPSEGAGHGWDVVSERSGGGILLPHPDGANAVAPLLPAHPNRQATFRAVRAVSDFLLSDEAMNSGKADSR